MKRSILLLLFILLSGILRLSAQTCLTSNIAAGRPVAATQYTDGATNVVDGDNSTLWQPSSDGDQWLYIDLGSNYSLCSVVLQWKAFHEQDTFDIQFSTDTSHWTTLAHNVTPAVDGPPGASYQVNTIDLSGSTLLGRYVRIYLYNIEGYNIQLQEMQVYNKLPVSLPVVTLTAPADGANYTEGQNIVLQATATDTGGIVKRVEFYQGTTKIGVDSTSPYSFTWIRVPEGEYSFVAKAIDTSGNSSVSAAIGAFVDFPNPSWSLTGNAGSNSDSSFLGTTDSTKLVFRTHNLKRMSILPNGNVGIGVDSPTAQLHTNGTVRFAGLTNDSTKTRLLVSDTAGNISYRTLSGLLSNSVLVQGGNTYGATTIVGTKDNNNLDFYTNNTGRARLTNTGNLLVGTTTDNGNKLQVNGNLSATGSSYINGFNFVSTANTSIIKSDSAKSILIGSPGTVSGTSGFTNHTSGSIVVHMPLNSGAGLTDSISNSVLIGGNSSLATATITNSLVVARDMGYDSGYNASLLKSNLITFGGTNGLFRDVNSGGASYLFRNATGNMYIGYDIANWAGPSGVPSNYIQVGGSHHTLMALFGGFHNIPPVVSTLAGPSYRPGDANSSFSTGQYFRIGAGRGTGSGNGSDLRFAVAPPGVSGTSLNPYIDAITISGSTAYVGIGTTTPQSMLAVNGTVTARKIKVTQSGWPDYVFSPTYKLLSLSELENYIRAHRHLPGVVSAKEVTRKGVDLGKNQAALLKKIEELTLYLIQQHQAAEDQDAEMDKQQQEIDALKKLIIRKNH